MVLEVLSELFEEDVYAQTYGELFTKKIEHLAEVILKGNTKPDEFNVFALEAGLGKSKYTNKIINENLIDFENARTYLIVKRFKEDVEEMEKFLGHFNPPKGFENNPNVLGITADNWAGYWREHKEKLKDISVLIITHKRYMDLCLDDELRHFFEDSREVLIIDEKVNFPVYTFSKQYYDWVRSLLPINIQNELDKVCGNLLKAIQKQEVEKNKNKCLRIEIKRTNKTLNNFLELMKVNLDNIEGLENKESVKHFLHGLSLWYNTKCLYNGGSISTFNRKHKLWCLKNNIILDASAALDGVYKVSKDYNIIGEERIINHSNSIFYKVLFNTSKSNLRTYRNQFYKEISEKIIENHMDNDQTLIICHKDNVKKIQEQMLKLKVTDIHVAKENEDEQKQNLVNNNYAINWFGNLTGKNEYSYFSQCWVIGTPNLPYEHYPIHYEMYGRKDHLDNKSLEIIPNQGRFRNKDLHQVQVGFITSEIYQSIKRIQRNISPTGKFFIVNSDEKIIKRVLSHIKGSDNVLAVELDFIEKQKAKHKRDNVDKLVEYLLSLPIGEYKKTEIAEKICVSSKNLNRYWTDTRVKALLENETGYIRVNYRSIVKLKEKEKSTE